LLGLPGGFLQYHEQPDKAVQREAAEEIGVAVVVDQLLDSYLVDYEFRGSVVSVVELAFLCRPIDADLRDIRTAEAQGAGYYDVRDILASPAKLAFAEQARALERYRVREGF
jgi:ADP-ribose pyrophosphatase YjhB (NUDIX family)